MTKKINFKMRDEVHVRFDIMPGRFNYMNLRCCSDLYLKAYMVCRLHTGQFISKDFFIERKNYDLNVLIDEEEICEILFIAFFNLENKRGALEIKDLQFSYREIPKDFGVISSPALHVGFDFNKNCGINYVSSAKYAVREEIGADGMHRISFAPADAADQIVPGSNLLNCYDKGRLIQQSYYGSNRPPYQNNCNPFGDLWRYNPVQEGDCYNNKSRLVDFEVSDKGLYVKLRPLDWAKQNSPVDAYMEIQYSFYKDALKVTNTFTDFSLLPPALSNIAQEMPAMYVVSPLRNFVYLNGTKIVREESLGFWSELQYELKQHFSVKDSWSAWINDEGYGVGLHTPDISDHFAGRYKADLCYDCSAQNAAAVNYTAAIKRFNFVSLDPVTYDYYLTVGSIEEIKHCFGLIGQKNGK